MRRAWFQVSMLLLLCTALVAAPCRNCQPTPKAETQKSHDCCPKPKSQPVKSCLWQPADLAAVDDTHRVDIAIPAAPVQLLAAERIQFESRRIPAQPIPVGSSPPLYETQSSLLI